MTTHDLVRRFVVLSALRWFPIGLALPFLVLLPQDRGLGLGEVGVVWGTHSIVAILTEVPSGGFADTVGRRTALLLGGVLTALGLAGVGVAPGLAAFMLGAAVIAAGRALISGSLEAWFVDEARAIDPDLALHRPLARGSTAEAIGTGVGAGVGGLLPLLAGGVPESGDAAIVQFSVPLLVGAVAALVYVVAVVRLVEEPRRVRRGNWREAGATTLAGLRSARASYNVRIILASAVAVGIVMSTTELLWQPRLEELLSGDTADHAPLFGALSAVSLLAFAAGSASSPRLSELAGRRRAYPGAYVALAASLALLAAAGTTLLFCAVYLLFFCALGVAAPLHQETLQEAIEGPNRATVTSAEGLALQVGGIGGNLMLAPLAGAAGIGLAWGISAGLALAAAVLAAATIPIVARTRPRPRPAAPSGAV